MFNFKKTIVCCLVSPMLSYAVIPSAAPFKTIVGDGYSFATTANSTGTFYTVKASDEYNWNPIGTVPTSPTHMFDTSLARPHEPNIYFANGSTTNNLVTLSEDDDPRSNEFPTSYGKIVKMASAKVLKKGGAYSSLSAITDQGDWIFMSGYPILNHFTPALLGHHLTNVVGNDFGMMALGPNQTYLFDGFSTSYISRNIPCQSGATVSLLAASPKYFYMICGTGKHAQLYSLNASEFQPNWLMSMPLFNPGDSSTDTDFSYSYAKLTNHRVLGLADHRYPGILFVEYSNKLHLHYALQISDNDPTHVIEEHFQTGQKYNISEIGAILDQSNGKDKNHPVIQGDALFVSPGTNKVLYLKMPQYKFAGTSMWL